MADGDLQMTFRPRLEVLVDIRRELRDWLDRCVSPPTVIDELVLAADELCANAIEAADGGMVQLDARCDGSAIHLAVSNAGNGDFVTGEPVAEPDGDPMLLERGRGLTIVRAFTDSLAIVNVDGRTVARAVRLLAT
jgi:anti-sigma regulatory factor (Ser/Thr protein kinase)